MDNININSSLSHEEIGNRKEQALQRKSSRFSAKLTSFFSAFLFVLASVFAINVATINTAEAEAKSQSAEHKVKKKKYLKKSRKNRRSKRSKRSRKGKKRYKGRIKKSRKYRKGKKRYKRSKRYRKGKRFYKTSYKKSSRYRKGKKRYKKSRKKRSKRSRRSRARARARTCDQLSSATLNRKAMRYQGTINHAARKYGVSSHFIKAVITVETCFRSGLRGTSGEKGLMQLMPATAKRFGVKNRFSTWENIHGGTRYLRYLLGQFNGNKAYAAAGYNGGRGAVNKKTGPKFYAVRNYSRMVMNAYRKFTPRLIRVKSKKKKSTRKKKS
jgi:hypothetical protein